MSGGARPQTAEIIKTFGERCPEVKVNNKPDKADYIVVLDHEGGKGFLRHKNKVAVFNQVSGDSVTSKSTLSLGGSVQEACEAIARDWSEHGVSIRAARAPATEKLVPAAAPAAIPAVAMSSTAKLQIDSTPPGADIEVDGSFVGSTPSDVQVAEGDHTVVVKKLGFKNWERKLKASAGSSVRVGAELEKADNP
jgi:CRISPR/Cas system-associated exonuclease Cas4 (RecB family)